jgi:glycosyltransferase involved in cell wall biosynthesis
MDPRHSSAADGSSAAVKIDLHVHSSFSDRPYSWFLRSSHAAECYTSPGTVYATAKARGMNLVTLCDHDTIDGALELRALADDTFISEEVSARFPEDGCIVHTIVVDITEAQHREIQALRANIYELVTYLHHQGVEFSLCHPLSQVNRRLQTHHLERCLLMFRNLELRNGTRDVAHEDALRRILAGLTAATMARYAERHPRTPAFNLEGRYGLVGGSDDHAGLSIARAFTTFEGARSGAGLTAALRERRTAPGGQHGSTAVLQHNAYGVLGGYLQRSSQGHHDHGHPHEGAEEATEEATEAAMEDGPSPALAATLSRYAELIATAQDDEGPFDFGGLLASGHTDPTQAQLSRLVESVLVRSSREAAGDVKDELLAARLVELADKIPALLKAITVSLPAILGARWHGHDIQSARRYSSGLGFAERARETPAVAILTDTVDDTNGVSLGLRRLAAAAVAGGHDLRLIAAGPGDHVVTDANGIVRLPAILHHRLADYPQMEFAVPHLPSLIGYLLENRIDLVQCSTPGPVGLMGLLAARTIGIPVVGQYHTDLPEYGTRLTGDPIVGAMLGKLVGWFYSAMDRVYAPSEAVVRRLDELGVPGDKVARIRRGIDLEMFSHARRDTAALAALIPDSGEASLTVLYVGRLSREKGLESLLDGFALAAQAVPRARLVVVGDGPQAQALAARAAASNRVHFLGARHGAELAMLMASSDLFVSPSETETFGNTVVEAQASGTPVIVAGRGAAGENMIDGITGMIVDGHSPEEIAGAIRLLLTEAGVRRHMGAAAIAFAQQYDMKNAAEATVGEYRRFLGNREVGAHAAAAHVARPGAMQPARVKPATTASAAAPGATAAAATGGIAGSARTAAAGSGASASATASVVADAGEGGWLI